MTISVLIIGSYYRNNNLSFKGFLLYMKDSIITSWVFFGTQEDRFDPKRRAEI